MDQAALTLNTEQGHKAIRGYRALIGVGYTKLLYGEIARGCQKSGISVVSCLGKANGIHLGVGKGTGHIQRLLHVKRTQRAVRLATVKVIHAVGQIRILLNFGNENPRTDGMQ